MQSTKDKAVLKAHPIECVMEIFVPKSSSLILLQIQLLPYTKAGMEGGDGGEENVGRRYEL